MKDHTTPDRAPESWKRAVQVNYQPPPTVDYNPPDPHATDARPTTCPRCGGPMGRYFCPECRDPAEVAHATGTRAAEAIDLLRRIREWDHLPLTGDGPYWMREIDRVLGEVGKE
jgi:hypothetical protein